MEVGIEKSKFDTAVLTIDTVAVTDEARYAAACAALTRESVAGLATVLTSRFGALNQFFLLQMAEGIAEACSFAAPPLPAEFSLQDRERTLLTQIRPFVAPTAEFGFLELRAYDVKVGLGDQFTDLFVAGLKTRTRYSENHGVWRSLTGRVDRVYHLWAFRGLEERDAVRGVLKNDPDWQVYLSRVLPLLQCLKTTLLTQLTKP
jgi:hypothetical protein